jgi:hypothetical protein
MYSGKIAVPPGGGGIRTTNDNCHICKQTFQPNQIKVRDHNHQTGEFRGLPHQACNLNYKDAHCFPIVFHNLSGYDAHFIIKELSTQFQGTIKLLPINKEKYIFLIILRNVYFSITFLIEKVVIFSTVEKIGRIRGENFCLRPMR